MANHTLRHRRTAAGLLVAARVAATALGGGPATAVPPAYTSLATNLVANDTNGVSDVFVFRPDPQGTVRATVSGTGARGNAASGRPYRCGRSTASTRRRVCAATVGRARGRSTAAGSDESPGPGAVRHLPAGSGSTP